MTAPAAPHAPPRPAMAEVAACVCVTVLPEGRQFSAALDEPVLTAALRAGLDWPRSCRNGSCRTCRVRLRSGAARHLIEWPGLSAEEKAEGWVLPCVAVALEDLSVSRAEEAAV